MPDGSVTELSLILRKVADGEHKQVSGVEIVDGSWLHLVDGSGWHDGVGKLKRFSSGKPDAGGSSNLESVLSYLEGKGLSFPRREA